MKALKATPMYMPGTLAEGLEAELAGLGSVRFIEGKPYWFAGEVLRWHEGSAVDEDYELALAKGRLP